MFRRKNKIIRMRYLKEYIDFLNWEGRVKEMTEREAQEWSNGRKWEPFTEREIESIDVNSNRAIILNNKSSCDFNNGKYEVHYIDENWVDIYISKWDDSWYLIQIGSRIRKYYLCDDFDTVVFMISKGIEGLVSHSDFFK